MGVMAQLALVFGLCLACEGVSAALPFPFPASVLSMVILLGLLLAGVVKEKHIDKAAAFLVGNMAFFFLPSCAGIVEYWEALVSVLLPFFLVAFITTPLVYAVTGWTVSLLMGRKRKEEGHD